MAIEIYNGPYTGQQVDDRLNHRRGAYTGNTGGGTIISSGATGDLSSAISLDDDSYYYIECFGQFAFGDASDDVIDLVFANIDFGLVRREGDADTTFDTFSASSTQELDTGLSTSTGAVKFTGYLQTGTSPTIQFQLSPSAGNALCYFFAFDIQKLYDNTASV